MSELVQNSVAIAACLAAAVFIGWRAWKAVAGRSSGCGTGCGSCPSSAKSKVSPARPLLSIDSGPDDRSPRRHNRA